MITIKEYKEAERERKELNKREDIQEKAFEEKSKKTYNKFSDLEKELDNKKEKEKSENKKEKNAFKGKIQEEREPHEKRITAFKRVLEFIEISKQDKKLNPQMYLYDYPRDEKGEVILDYPEKEKQYIKPLEIIKNDEFAKIGIFIYKNNKPKNKYTLCVVGDTIFNEDVLKIPHDYGVDHEENANIRELLKDMPTKNDLAKYWKKNKGKILKEFLEEHKKVEEEYTQVIRDTKTNEWQKVYWESKKDYYEKQYSKGKETDKYEAILKELEKFK